MNPRGAIGLLLSSLALAACQTLPPAAPDVPVPVAEAPSAPTEPLPAPPEPQPAAAPVAPPAAPTRLADGAAVFDAIRRQLQPPVCAGGPLAERWRSRLAKHPASVERQLREALPRMAYVAEALIAAGLPTEFVFIPLIESGYRPDARGRGGPLGLWQFVPSTARAHGLRVGGGHDERLSIERSTAAAVDYLRALKETFNDWRAVALAYNAGAGAVQRAFARTGDRDVDVSARRPSGLRSITYAYVAKLDAWSCLVSNPQHFGLTLPEDAFEPLPASGDSVPAKPTDTGTSPPTPASNPAAVTTAPQRYQVQAGDTLWSLARRFGTSVRALQAANGLGRRSTLRVGQWLRLP